MQQIDISIPEYAYSPDIAVLHQRDRESLDFQQPLYEYRSESYHEQRQHVAETIFSEMSVLHVEASGLETTERSLNSPAFPVQVPGIVALKGRGQDYQ